VLKRRLFPKSGKIFKENPFFNRKNAPPLKSTSGQCWGVKQTIWDWTKKGLKEKPKTKPFSKKTE